MMGSGADGRGEAGYLEKTGDLCSDGAGLFVLITHCSTHCYLRRSASGLSFAAVYRR
jgi:hypothetical protein